MLACLAYMDDHGIDDPEDLFIAPRPVVVDVWEDVPVSA